MYVAVYMDSTSDCSPTVRETGDRQVTVFGRGATQSGASPDTCELSLRVDQPRDPKRYRISLLDMDIRDCSVSFYIYDGTRDHSMLVSFFSAFLNLFCDITIFSILQHKPFTALGVVATLLLSQDHSFF